MRKSTVRHKPPIQDDYIRSIIFGLQDSLVSTTGVVIGLSATMPEKKLVLIASVITVTVEAISMAAGQYVSEKTLHDRSPKLHKDSLLIGSIAMLLAYTLAGFIPIIPIVILSYPMAPIVAACFTLVAFIVIGYVKSRFTKTSALRSSLELLIIGGVATAIGTIVGLLMQNL